MSVRAFVAAAASTALVACAGAAMRSSAPTAGSAPVQTMPGADAAPPSHQEIDDLAREIDTERAKLPAPTAAQMSGGGSPTCVRNPSAVCTQTCQLTDSICSNAEKICDIAKKLQGDDWAATKCKDNRATCSTATTQCCECTPGA